MRRRIGTVSLWSFHFGLHWSPILPVPDSPDLDKRHRQRRRRCPLSLAVWPGSMAPPPRPCATERVFELRLWLVHPNLRSGLAFLTGNSQVDPPRFLIQITRSGIFHGGDLL